MDADSDIGTPNIEQMGKMNCVTVQTPLPNRTPPITSTPMVDRVQQASSSWLDRDSGLSPSFDQSTVNSSQLVTNYERGPVIETHTASKAIPAAKSSTWSVGKTTSSWHEAYSQQHPLSLPLPLLVDPVDDTLDSVNSNMDLSSPVQSADENSQAATNSKAKMEDRHFNRSHDGYMSDSAQGEPISVLGTNHLNPASVGMPGQSGDFVLRGVSGSFMSGTVPKELSVLMDGGVVPDKLRSPIVDVPNTDEEEYAVIEVCW